MVFLFQHFCITNSGDTCCYSYLGFKWLGHLCNIAINFQIFLNNYHYILPSYLLASSHLDLLFYLLVYYIFPESVFFSCICISWKVVSENIFKALETRVPTPNSIALFRKFVNILVFQSLKKAKNLCSL